MTETATHTAAHTLLWLHGGSRSAHIVRFFLSTVQGWVEL